MTFVTCLSSLAAAFFSPTVVFSFSTVAVPHDAIVLIMEPDRERETAPVLEPDRERDTEAGGEQR